MSKPTKKSTEAEIERRVTAIYQLLMQQETYAEIVRYAPVEWNQFEQAAVHDLLNALEAVYNKHIKLASIEDKYGIYNPIELERCVNQTEVVSRAIALLLVD